MDASTFLNGTSANTLLLVKLSFRAWSYIRKLACDVRLVSSQMIDGGRNIKIILEGLNEVVSVISSPGPAFGH